MAGKAQTGGCICITNNRHCDIELRLVGNCMGSTPCDGVSALVRIGANSSKCFTNVLGVISSSISTTEYSPCPTGVQFEWHGAEIQSVDCEGCGGFGVSIGDNTCTIPITSSVYGPPSECCACPGTPCAYSMGCADWNNAGGCIEIVAYEM
ncbi:MAG: hypothetical protein IT256_07485 [Chitinophagaceae bacterium]|nr:hypothetical protein [Chitinophagaceae bacterium]